jgi:hypothetical protein
VPSTNGAVAKSNAGRKNQTQAKTDEIEVQVVDQNNTSSNHVDRYKVGFLFLLVLIGALGNRIFMVYLISMEVEMINLFVNIFSRRRIVCGIFLDIKTITRKNPHKKEIARK